MAKMYAELLRDTKIQHSVEVLMKELGYELETLYTNDEKQYHHVSGEYLINTFGDIIIWLTPANALAILLDLNVLIGLVIKIEEEFRKIQKIPPRIDIGLLLAQFRFTDIEQFQIAALEETATAIEKK